MIGSTLGKGHHRYADVCYKVGWHHERRARYHDSLYGFFFTALCCLPPVDIPSMIFLFFYYFLLTRRALPARQWLRQALNIYESDVENIYRNEAARTCFLMSRVSAKLADEHSRAEDDMESNEWAEKSAQHSARAKMLRKEIPSQSLLTQEGETEAGYDDLVMFWSR